MGRGPLNASFPLTPADVLGAPRVAHPHGDRHRGRDASAFLHARCAISPRPSAPRRGFTHSPHTLREHWTSGGAPRRRLLWRRGARARRCAHIRRDTAWHGASPPAPTRPSHARPDRCPHCAPGAAHGPHCPGEEVPLPLSEHLPARLEPVGAPRADRPVRRARRRAGRRSRARSGRGGAGACPLALSLRRPSSSTSSRHAPAPPARRIRCPCAPGAMGDGAPRPVQLLTLTEPPRGRSEAALKQRCRAPPRPAAAPRLEPVPRPAATRPAPLPARAIALSHACMRHVHIHRIQQKVAAAGSRARAGRTLCTASV